MKLKIAFSVAAAASLILGISACASEVKQEPNDRVVEKAVPTPVACVSNQTPPPSAYPDTDAALKAAKDFAARYGLIARGRIMRDQRLAEIEPLLQACRQP